jgi:hypothetical protein
VRTSRGAPSPLVSAWRSTSPARRLRRSAWRGGRPGVAPSRRQGEVERRGLALDALGPDASAVITAGVYVTCPKTDLP